MGSRGVQGKPLGLTAASTKGESEGDRNQAPAAGARCQPPAGEAQSVSCAPASAWGGPGSGPLPGPLSASVPL